MIIIFLTQNVLLEMGFIFMGIVVSSADLEAGRKKEIPQKLRDRREILIF